MKIFSKGVFTITAMWLVSVINAVAIEGLQLSIQSSNVVLAWPSHTNETYIAQYRPSLTSTSSWTTLTNFFPAQANTNVTIFTHSNSVQYGSLGSGGSGSGNGGGGAMIPTNGGSSNYSSVTNAKDGVGFYRVVRNGAHIYGLTNGMILKSVMRLPIELAVDTTNEIAGVTFYANGSPLIGASAEGAGYAWVLNWDTTMMPNGDYDITAQVDFVSQDEATNTIPVTLTVSNVISFPNYFTRIYGEQLWIYAELATAAASFQIDMYDENTNYLGSFADSTTDGVISFTWDLTDGNGYTFESTNFFGVFTVTPTTANGNIHPLTGGSSSTAKQTWAKESAWYPYDKWVIAYGPFDASGFVTGRQLLTMLGGQGGEFGGIIHALNGYNLGNNLSPGNVDQTSAFALSDATAKTNLLGYLADSQFRNFYFFGHGSPSSIRGVDPTSKIGFYDIQKALGNFVSSPKPQNFHPYRLVFVDGCSGGAGNFCEAFGIPAQSVDRSFFSGAAVWSRAFLSFKSWKNYDRNTYDWYALMMAGFISDWQSNKPLQECVDNAANGTHTSGYVKMDSSWVIYGATNLVHNQP